VQPVKRSTAARLGLAGALLLAAAGLGSGCATVGYYGQAVAGHLDLVQRARPVDDWLADPATPEPLRQRLALSRELRTFAVRELALPDNRSYTRYAALDRPAVVWNVVAAPELSLQPRTWCFLFAGCVGYRGYFDRAAAQATADALRREGWEVDLYGVPAYSTLGRTDFLGGDPLLSTFVGGPPTELARLLFHELAHQVVYVRDDTTFNESYATAVERLGLQRWLAAHGTPALRAQHEAIQARRADFQRITRAARAALEAVYAAELPDDAKRARKAAVMAELRTAHQALKDGPWQGFAGYDPWFARANNATLAVQAAYDELVPAFERLFEREGGDFARFHAAVRGLAALPREARREQLARLAAP
jgi:predicted aminopeptidase